MRRQALKFINAKRVCTGTRQVVFWGPQNVFSTWKLLAPMGRITLRSRWFW